MPQIYIIPPPLNQNPALYAVKIFTVPETYLTNMKQFLVAEDEG
jgi:hypothetical protein